MTEADLVIRRGRVLTLAPLKDEHPRTGASAGDVGAVDGGWVAARDGVVVATGKGDAWETLELTSTASVVDAEGSVVMPGFVDAHTHLCYAGQRWDEFAARRSGADYLAVLERGGGIHATVRATRETTDDDLVALVRARLAEAAALGTTTIEVKSGYGLEPDEELRQLRVIARAARDAPIDVSPTYLALHALPAADFYPFDASTALQSSLVPFCAFWPDASAAPAPPPPLPGVPTLILAGEQDLRTPAAGAERVQASIPGAQLLVVPYTGHSVLGSDFSGCAEAAVSAFFSGRAVQPCPSAQNLFAPTPISPTRLAFLRPPHGLGGKPGRTLTAVPRGARGHPDTPLDSDALRAKYLACATLVLPIDEAEGVAEQLAHLEDIPDIRALTSRLAGDLD